MSCTRPWGASWSGCNQRRHPGSWVICIQMRCLPRHQYWAAGRSPLNRPCWDPWSQRHPPLPVAFFTNTTLANHLGYWISLMWLAFNSFSVSSRMTKRLSSLNFHLLWRTSRTWWSMVRRWHRKSGSMSGMSEQTTRRRQGAALWPRQLDHATLGSKICQAWTSSHRSLFLLRLRRVRVISPRRSLHGWSLLPLEAGSNSEHPSLCLEAIFVALLGLFLVRLDGDHHTLKGRKLHLHMPCGGNCSNPV